MPIWLLAIPGTIKRVLSAVPWQVWAGIAALCIVLLAHHQGAVSGRAGQKAKDDRHIAQLRSELTQAFQNVAILKRALADQNAAVAQWQADADARVKAGQDALGRAKERERAAQGSIAALEAAGRATAPRKTPCPVSKVNSDALDVL